MDDQTIWILGYGRVTISKQFSLDLVRIPNLTINGIPLPQNIYQATRLLYDICDIHYYHYSKYMNQTLGNMMISYIQKMYKCHIIGVSQTYEVHAVYGDTKKINATMCVQLHDDMLIQIGAMRVTCCYDINSSNTNVSLYSI